MFKKLKDKISEEVGQSSIRLPIQQLSQLASYVSEGSRVGRSDLSLAGSAAPAKYGTQSHADASIASENIDGGALSIDGDGGRSETASVGGRVSGGARARHHAKTVGDWLRHPDGHLHCQHADLDAVSEVSSLASLGTVTKEQLLQSYQRIRAKYSQQRARHAELARSCHALEVDCRLSREALQASEAQVQQRDAELKQRLSREEELRAELQQALQQRASSPGPQEHGEGGAGDTSPVVAEVNGSAPTATTPLAPGDAERSAEVDRLKDKVAQLEGLLVKCKESIRQHKTRLSAAAAEKEQLQQQAEQQLAQSSVLQEGARAELERLKEALSELRSQLEHSDGQVQRLQQEAAEAQQLVKTAESEAAKLSEDHEMQLKKLREQFDKERSTLVQELSQYKLEHEGSESGLQKKHQDLDSRDIQLSQKEQDCDRKAESWRAELETLQGRTAELEQELASAREAASQGSRAIEELSTHLGEQHRRELSCLQEEHVSSLESRLAEQAAEHQRHLRELESQHQAALQELERERSQCKAGVAEHQELLRRSQDLEAQLETERARVEADRQEHQELLHRSQELEARLETERARIEADRQEHQELVHRSQELEAQLETERARVEADRQEHQKLLHRSQELETERARVEADKQEHQELVHRSQELEAQLETERARVEADRQEHQELLHRSQELEAQLGMERARVEADRVAHQDLLHRSQELEAQLRKERGRSEAGVEREDPVRDSAELSSALTALEASLRELDASSAEKLTPAARPEAGRPAQLVRMSAGRLASLAAELRQERARRQGQEPTLASPGQQRPWSAADEETSEATRRDEGPSDEPVMLGWPVDEQNGRLEVERRSDLGSQSGRLPAQSDASVAALQRETLACRRQLQQAERRHQREVSELRRLLALRHTPPPAADSAATLDAVTEVEYLRNILYEYMMGREPLTLAKVITAVLKFNSEQTAKVLEKEEQRQSLLPSGRSAVGSTMDSVGSTLSALSPFKWS
ncbi:GRIP1-associated protein 1-like isoform X4 [Pollicipes pollicipes]|uniref:GRIP1-associated protein 1-like isoform X4 n=1 Tax=Pollicipes pollicipes TaxID=41117 RepID=UPI001884F91B|nr:GRIP1-associated protein 1-like isoform X4 [Pollicipes pollicipes]